MSDKVTSRMSPLNEAVQGYLLPLTLLYPIPSPCFPSLYPLSLLHLPHSSNPGLLSVPYPLWLLPLTLSPHSAFPSPHSIPSPYFLILLNMQSSPHSNMHHYYPIPLILPPLILFPLTRICVTITLFPLTQIRITISIFPSLESASQSSYFPLILPLHPHSPHPRTYAAFPSL